MKNFAFHLALPCEDIEKTKAFYLDILGAKIRKEHGLLDRYQLIRRSNNFYPV